MPVRLHTCDVIAISLKKCLPTHLQPLCVCVRVCVSACFISQGWYSLGVLVQEEQGLPLSVLSELGLTQHYMADNTELATTLYRRYVLWYCTPFTTGACHVHYLRI